MKIYNTLTKKIEDFKPINPPNVTMYSCGPTVYDFAHIGHFRTYVGTDILKNVLAFNNFQVKQVMNITDVGHLTSDADTGEDKLEKGAKREGKTVWEIAKFYTDDFFTALQKLNIKKAEVISKATDHIPEMINLIKTLETKGFTYKLADGIYFDTSKFKDYGKLSGSKEGIKAGARVEMVQGKKNPTDFALWKLSSSTSGKRQMEWASPWGTGFPGWHIECSAMAMKYLGNTLDIHTGGIDHIPIHHENEIAQSESATGQKFVNFWVHYSFLMVDGKKMSKSLGNIYNQKDIEDKGFSLLDCRYLFLTAHYRDSLNFTWESLKAAKTARANLNNIVSDLRNKKTDSQISEEKLGRLNTFREEFTEAINNDLNIPQALAVLWELVKSTIPPSDKYDLILEMDQVFGLNLINAKSEEINIPEDVQSLINKREESRKNHKWSESDKIRIEIENKGFLIEDLPVGVKIRKK